MRRVILSAVQEVVMQRVAKLGDLRNIAGPGLGTADDMVYVEAFLDRGDRGEGIFRWDSQSEDPDNFGTVVQPSAAQNKGRWKRVYDGHAVSACWFGADPRGQRDSENFIKNALKLAAR